MKWKIGDRFKMVRSHTARQIDSIWEVLGESVYGGYRSICVDGCSDLKDRCEDWLFTSDMWEYLGNFSKTDNFTELYNLFNS